jgi:DNA-binding protein HU-beta
MATKKPAAKAETVAPKAVPVKTPAPPVITLKQLATTIAEKQGQTIKEVSEILTGAIDRMVMHLKQGDRLKINRLGILEVKHRAARTGRNPATGEQIDIAESKKIAFRAAKELKDAVLEA